MRIDLPVRGVKLSSSEAFLANPETLTRMLHPEGESLFGHYLRANCGGIALNYEAEEILAALRKAPNLKAPTSAVIGWFLGSMKPWEARNLITLCGVPVYFLAEHLRAHGIQYDDVIIMLNQFAADEGVG